MNIIDIARQSRLEYLRGEIRAERISYAEIAELQSLVEYIASGDVELLEWAGKSEATNKNVAGTPNALDKLENSLSQHDKERR